MGAKRDGDRSGGGGGGGKRQRFSEVRVNLSQHQLYCCKQNAQAEAAAPFARPYSCVQRGPSGHARVTHLAQARQH
jgi:hypothetical protein